MYIAITRPQYEDNFFCPAAMKFFQPTYSLDDFIVPAAMIARCGSLKRNKPQQLNQHETNVKNNNSNFEVKLNVQNYKPEELDVKTENNYVVITGKHEEKEDDHGFVSRQFSRRYTLPQGVKPESITCNLTSEGVLSVSAPLAIENAPENERKIPITLTEQPIEISTSTTLPEKVISAENAEKVIE